MKSASYEYRKKMSARRGAQFVPIGMPTISWKTFLPKTTKMLSTRNSRILMKSFSAYLFFESACSLENRVLRDLKLKKIVSAISIFVNETVSDDSCESAYKFLVRNGCVKGRKIKELDVCDMVEIWRLKMF